MNSSNSPNEADERVKRGKKILVIGAISFFLFVVFLGIMPNLSPTGKWILFGTPVGLLALLFLIGAMSGSKNTTDSGNGVASGFTILLAIVAVGAVATLFMENVKKQQASVIHRVRQEQVTLMPPPPPEPRQHYVVEAPVGREIRIPVNLGMTCDTDPVNPGQSVWVRWEGEERFKDWKGKPSGGTKKHAGSNYKYLQSAEVSPVKVEVRIYPEQ